MAVSTPALDRIGLTADVAAPFDTVRTQVVDALKAEGFGILTEIDVTATLKAKLGVDFTRYVILGACSPPLAHAALSADPGIGLLLPCNVCVWEQEGRTVVSIARPDALFGLVSQPGLEPIMADATARLTRALAGVTERNAG